MSTTTTMITSTTTTATTTNITADAFVLNVTKNQVCVCVCVCSLNGGHVQLIYVRQDTSTVIDENLSLPLAHLIGVFGCFYPLSISLCLSVTISIVLHRVPKLQLHEDNVAAAKSKQQIDNNNIIRHDCTTTTGVAFNAIYKQPFVQHLMPCQLSGLY